MRASGRSLEIGFGPSDCKRSFLLQVDFRLASYNFSYGFFQLGRHRYARMSTRLWGTRPRRDVSKSRDRDHIPADMQAEIPVSIRCETAKLFGVSHDAGDTLYQHHRTVYTADTMPREVYVTEDDLSFCSEWSLHMQVRRYRH